MRIGIAGAGGIGSNVACQLVRGGIRHFKIVDFDTIETSNLNRQFYFADQVGQPKASTLAANLARIDPDIHVAAVHTRLDSENMAHTFCDTDVVVEGFDGAQDKKVLLETFTGSQKLVVSASGVAGLELDAITTQTMANCHIVGDFTTAAGGDNLYAPKVILIASIMSQIVLKHYLSGVLK
jgi:sulfur carrier protein ThiS adenylyltransferase